MPEDTLFNRRRSQAGEALKRAKEAANNAFGVGKSTPYGHVKLTGAQKIQYFQSQPDAKKLELWQQMDDSERDEIGKGVMGQ